MNHIWYHKREILSNMYSTLNDMYDIVRSFGDFCLLLVEQEHIRQYEQNVQDHQQYHDASQALVDWLTLMKDRFSLCSDTSGDSHTLQSKLDRVQVTAFYTTTNKVMGGVFESSCPPICLSVDAILPPSPLEYLTTAWK